MHLLPPSDRVKGCELLFPETVFFKNGKPERIVFTDQDYYLKQSISDEKLILNNILKEFMDIYILWLNSILLGNIRNRLNEFKLYNFIKVKFQKFAKTNKYGASVRNKFEARNVNRTKLLIEQRIS